MRVVSFNDGEPIAEPAADVVDAIDPGADALSPDVPEYPLVLVVWHDAWFDFDQTGPDDCRSDYVVRTVGFLVGDGPQVVSVAQEILPDGDGFRAVTHIPASLIEGITPLAEALPDLQEQPGA